MDKTDYERGRLAGYAEGVEAAAGEGKRWALIHGHREWESDALAAHIRALRAPSLPECSPESVGQPCSAAASCGWYGDPARCSAACAPSPKEDAPHGRCRCAERVVIPRGAEVVWVGTISHSRLYGCYERPVPSPKEDAPRLDPETLEDLRRIAPPSTHRCIVCGAHWRANPPTKIQPHGSWSLRYGDKAGPCCDNAPMGPQLVTLPGACFACQGTGVWSRLWAEANGGNPACPDCGGTGRSTMGSGRVEGKVNAVAALRELYEADDDFAQQDEDHNLREWERAGERLSKAREATRVLLDGK